MIKFANINPIFYDISYRNLDLEYLNYNNFNFRIILVKDNSGYIYCENNVKLEYEKNDILFLQPNQNCKFSKELINIGLIEFDFFPKDYEYNYEDFLLFNKINLHLVMKLTNTIIVENVFENLIIEQKGIGLYSNLLTKSYFEILIVNLIRSNELSKNVVKNNYVDKLKDLKEYVIRNIDRPFELDDIATYMDISRWHLVRIFNEYLNTTPVRYINTIRIKRAIELIKYSDMTINEISKKMNFNSQQSFTRWFKSIDGHSPIYYRKNGSLPKVGINR